MSIINSPQQNTVAHHNNGQWPTPKVGITNHLTRIQDCWCTFKCTHYGGYLMCIMYVHYGLRNVDLGLLSAFSFNENRLDKEKLRQHKFVYLIKYTTNYCSQTNIVNFFYWLLIFYIFIKLQIITQYSAQLSA